MAKEISQEMFDMLTSTMWQDYKGYKRELNIKSNIERFFFSLSLAVIGIYCTSLFFIEGDIFIFLGTFSLAIAGYGIWYIVNFYILRWCRMAKVNNVAYDIELSSTDVKMIRTKKKKYGIVCDCDNGSDKYLRLILTPKYDMINRTDDDSFIISSKRTFSKKLCYGIYNSSLGKITVPVRFDKIFRPKDSANLYIAEKNGETYKFNSMGDRIVR